MLNQKWLKQTRQHFTMARLIALVLLLFYLLGVFVFHAPATIHFLPLLALLVLIIDYFIARHYQKR